MAKCKDCGRSITKGENEDNRGKCGRCAIGDYYG